MDPPDESSFDLPVQRSSRQRRASHPPARDLLTAHRNEMFRALDAFERDWAVPLMGRRFSPTQPSQRHFSTPDQLFSSFLDSNWPSFRTPPALRPTRSVPANVKTVVIEWQDDDVPPPPPPPHPRIEDVSSSADPEVLNTTHRQNVCVVEMPSAVDTHTHTVPNAHTHLFNPNAPVVTDLSTDINDE